MTHVRTGLMLCHVYKKSQASAPTQERADCSLPLPAQVSREAWRLSEGEGLEQVSFSLTRR